MEKKQNYNEYLEILKQNNITKLYHFTDRDNLQSIIDNGGLYSWADCEDKGISIAKPGGSSQSRSLDSRDNLQHFVRVSFTRQHPMMYVAMNEGRISNPVILEIDPEVIVWQHTEYADMNATKNGANVGEDISDFKQIHFKSVKANKHFDLDDDEQKYFQAEVLVKNHIPLEYIKNIGDFGIPLPSRTQLLQSKIPYTAQITRNTPTAFIFLIDQSGSMRGMTRLNGEEMTKAEAVARIVNRQINELVLRCIKADDIRHYYDIAVIGYGHKIYSGWNGDLEGRFFVSPKELNDNPFKRITVREEKRTRRGTVVKEVEKVQWVEARCDGHWTYLHKAFDKTHELLSEWLEKYHNKDCYPPTIINITDGEYNGADADHVRQQANELKSMFTNDGNVLLFNIHIASGSDGSIVFPIAKGELGGSCLAGRLFDLSSLLPVRYNQPIANIRNDADGDSRHVAMAVNADMSTLIQLMDIGTPTNIVQSK